MMWSVFKNQKEIKINQKYYLLIKDKWAKKMSGLTSNLSRRSLVVYLMLFIITSGSISIYNIYSAFFSKEKSITTGIISNSTSVVMKPVQVITNESVLSKTEFEKIICINSYLDSLKQSKKGQKLYDSIKNYRPGLLDSLVFIENYYKTNFKK